MINKRIHGQVVYAPENLKTFFYRSQVRIPVGAKKFFYTSFFWKIDKVGPDIAYWDFFRFFGAKNKFFCKTLTETSLECPLLENFSSNGQKLKFF